VPKLLCCTFAAPNGDTPAPNCGTGEVASPPALEMLLAKLLKLALLLLLLLRLPEESGLVL
jgi:hypothetical protein